jgi:hypothetical protein
MDGLMGHDEAIREIVVALRRAGLDADVRGELLSIRLDDAPLGRPIIWLGPGAVEDIETHRGAFVLAEHIPGAIASRLRDGGAWFADAAGNAFIRAPGVIVDIRGRARRTTVRPRDREPVQKNLMSARRAQVVFSLLTWPELVGAPLRDVARVAGVSLAVAHETTSILSETHYLDTRRAFLDFRGELVDQWARAFATGLGRAIELGRFIGEPSPDAWVFDGRHVAVSGEAAVPGLKGDGLTLYVESSDPRAIARARWRRPRAPTEVENIVLRRKFWRAPREPFTAKPGVDRAPDLLVYADLLASGDARQREVAETLRASLVRR